MKFRILVLLILFLSNSLIASTIVLTDEEKLWLENNPQVTFLVDDLKPLSFKNHRAEIDGFLVDYIRLIEDAIGYPDLISLRLRESIDDIHNLDLAKEFHGFAPIVYTPKNKQDYRITEPFIFSKFVIFGNKNVVAVYNDDYEFSAGIGIYKEYQVLYNIINKAVKTAITTIKRQEVLSRWLDKRLVNFDQALNLSDREIAWIKAHPTITVAETLDFQPLLIESSMGAMSGLIPDLFDLMGERLGIKFNYIADDWLSVLSRVQAKELDVVGAMNKKIAQSKGFLSVDSPIDHVTTVFAKKTRSFDITSDKDIKGLRIAYFQRILFLDHYLEKVKEQVTLIKTSSPLDAVKAVIDGKADIMIGLNFDRYLLTKNSIVEIEPIYAFKGLKPQSVIGVRSDYSILAKLFEKVIHSMSLDERERILSKWTWVSKVPKTISKNKSNKISKNKSNKMSKNISNKIELTAEETAYLEQHPTISVQNLNTFPPFNFNEYGRPKGYSVDYMKLVAKQLGVELKFISDKPWHEYLQMMKNKTLDVIPHIAITEERKQFIDFTDFHHIEYITGMAIKKDSEVKSMVDLSNKVIAVAKKTFIHTHLKKNFPDISLLLTASSSEAVEAVSTGRADAVIGSLPSLHYFIQKNWLSNIKTIKINDLDMPEKTQLPMGVAKGNKLLKSILSKANNAIPHNKVAALRNKWMDIQPLMKNEVALNDTETQYLENKKEITMCIDPDWMPFEKNENGKHIGMSADYIEILKKAINSEIRMIPTNTWPESLELGKQRKCDIFSLVMSTPEREKYYDYTIPYISVPLVIATNIKQAFINDIPSVVDKKIGIVNGYAYVELLKTKYPNMKLVTVKNVVDGLEKVRDEKLFGFIGALSTVGFSIQKNYIGELKIAGKFEETWDLGIGVRNDEAILKNIFDKAIKTITPKQHQDILNKWVSVNFQKGLDATIIWQLSLGFLIILALILYRNRSVEKINIKLKEANKAINEQQQMVDKYVLILTTDLDGIICTVNDAYCNAIGYPKEELIGLNSKMLRHPDMTSLFFETMWATISNNKTWTGEVKNRTKNQETIYFKLYIEPIIKDNIKIGYRAISEDITDKKRVEVLSITDKLTGLYNRLKLDEILSMEVEKYKRYKTFFSVIIIDIDDFKAVNDTYGHDIGDSVLKKVASILKENIRSLDVIGRWGGEEFVIVCESTNIENAFILAENLRKIIENASFDRVGDLTISLGVTEFREGDNLSSVFKKADEALYVAKQSGKNKTIK